jgi:uncharacterized protein
LENETPAPFERSKPVAQLLMFIGIALISFFILGVILVLVQQAGLIDLFKIQDPASYADDSVVQASRYVELLQDFFVFIIPTIVISFLVTKKKLQYLQLNTTVNFSLLILGAITIIISMPVINFMGQLNQHIPLPDFLQRLEQEADAIEAAFEMHHTIYDLICNLIVMALMAGICEELFFRAGLQKLIMKMTKNPHVAIWITGAIFSAIHFQFSGFFPRMFLGVFLGYLFYWSGSVWVNIFAHCMFNGIQIVVQYLQDIKVTPGIVDKTFSENPEYGYVIVSTVLVAFLLVAIYRLSGRKNEIMGQEQNIISE